MKIKVITATALLLCFSLFLTGCGGYREIAADSDDLEVVGKIADKDVYLEELRFVTFYYLELMKSRYGEDVFDGDDAEKYLDELCGLVYDNITYNTAVVLLCEEVGISLGEEAVINKVNETLSDTVENELGSFRKYKKYLKENNLTDHFLRYSTEISILENELMYVYIDDLSLIENDDDKLYDIIKDEFIRVRHVFIPHSEDGAEEKIRDVLSSRNSGTEFSLLMNTYNRDADMTESGKAILEGYMTDEYWSAASALGVGECSQVVEDYNGYYVIERLELSPTSIMFEFDSLKELYQAYTFYAMIDEKQVSLEFIPNEACKAFIKEIALS